MFVKCRHRSYDNLTRLEEGHIMFGFGRKRKSKRSQQAATAGTFVEATDGGWSNAPDVVAADGGSQKDFVQQTLDRACHYADSKNVAFGEQFTYTLTDIPKGISSPHEIAFGLMMEAHRYGLAVISVTNEVVNFERRQ